MLIVDTSVWIEFLRAQHGYHAALLPLIEEGQVIALECIFAELLQGTRNERERKVVEQFWEALPRLEIPRLFLMAGRLASVDRFPQKGVGLIDAMIVAAARRMKYQVWSLDKKLNAVLRESERHVSSILGSS
jgi:predicted nucleic acid-binding protein